MNPADFLPVRSLGLEGFQDADPKAPHLAKLRQEVAALMAAGQDRAAVDRLAEGIPVVTMQRLEDERYRIHATYELALLHLTALEWEEGRRLLDSIDLPASADLQLLPFDSFSFAATRLHEMQSSRIKCGRPAIAIVSMPKSASAFLTRLITDMLDVPVLRTSILDCVVPRWVRQLCRGACTTHEHYPARPDNVRALIEGGLKRLFVQLRDPRAAAFSWLYHDSLNASGRANEEDLLIENLMPLTARRARWAQDWIGMQRRLHDTGRALDVTLIPFRDFTADPATTLLRILDQAGVEGVDRPAVDEYFAMRVRQNRLPDNFREGDDDAWRKMASSAVRQALWDVIPDDVRRTLHLER